MAGGMIPAHIAVAAKARGFDAAAVAAIVEVESMGAGLAPDGRPVILYEPHIAYRVAQPGAREMLVSAGLARPKWVKDYPASQAARWNQFDRCAKIAGRDVAIQATSWGLGQVLGLNWRSCGFASPADFEAMQATEAGQVETMLRYLEGADLFGAIQARDWAAIARSYNGPAYRANRYDERMEAAYRRITGHRSPVVLRVGDSGPAVRELQALLGEQQDGQFGPRTRAMVEEFQRRHGLVVDGVVGAQTWAAMREDVRRAPPAQPAPMPVTDWTATAGKVAAGASAVTAAVKGVSEASETTAALLSAIDPTLVALGIGAGLALMGGAFVARRMAQRSTRWSAF